MSKVVGVRQIVFQGNEVETPVICCEWAVTKIIRLVDTSELIYKLNDIVNPNDTGMGFTIVRPNRNDLFMEYCPICGDAINPMKVKLGVY